MAKITASNYERAYRIDKFLGLNEAVDGDTGLKMGEAAVMRNFRITAEGNLQVRPGYHAVCALADSHPVRGMWHGHVAGVERWLAACNGHLYSINLTTYAATDLGTLTDAATSFFPFNDKVYVLNGAEYKYWDGTTFGDVGGYVPIIATATPPAGGGTLLEEVNKLTGSKRQQFSPDGSATVFYLAETAVASVDWVKLNDVTKTPTTDYTVNLTNGTVTFVSTPSAGTNTVEIQWTKGTGDRAVIVAQKYAEMYNGSTDNRIFLYGSGANKAYYSGLDENGTPSAEYFPDLNVLDVGAVNTPITAMVRQFNKLIVFKTDSTYFVDFDIITLSDGTTTAGFYTKAIDKEIGHEAPGQVNLVNNFPVSLFGNSAYRWGVAYSSGVQDERSSKRISDNVRDTLGGMTLSDAVTFDDEWNREFWIVQGETACIYQYANEAQGNTSYKSNLWYQYTGIPAACFVAIGGELYFGSTDGYIMRMSRDYHSDNGADIDAYWESGSMSFEREYMRKFMNRIHTVLKPEVAARVTVTLETDRKSDFTEKAIGSGVLNFTHLDFAHWSFLLNNKPRTVRTKLKAKKFTTLKLIFKSISSSATATILSCVLHVTDTGEAK